MHCLLFSLRATNALISAERIYVLPGQTNLAKTNFKEFSHSWFNKGPYRGGTLALNLHARVARATLTRWRNRIKPQPKTREKAENQICTCSGRKAKGRATQAEAHSESYSGPIRNASGTTNPANSQCWCVKHIEGVGSAEATYEWKEKRAALSESGPDSTQRRSGKSEKLLQARAPAFRADCGELWPTFSLQRSVSVDRSVSSGCCKLNFKELKYQLVK